jgi:hypothetical protein
MNVTAELDAPRPPARRKSLAAQLLTVGVVAAVIGVVVAIAVPLYASV